MQINSSLFEEIAKANAKILVVTKYWDKEQTEQIIQETQEKFPEIFFGIGENRIENIVEKKIDRKLVHYIGNIQTKKIQKITEYCSTIHSLDSIKHAEKIQYYLTKNRTRMNVFLQINLDPLKSRGIKPENIPEFLMSMKKFSLIRIIGVSGMGALEYTEEEKKTEFKLLKKIQEKFYLSLVSAGTSQDYQIALDQDIEVVRIGQSAVKKIS